MLVWLADFAGTFPILNVFRYITFRAGGATATALLFVFFFGPAAISWLRIKQGKGQPIRTDGPETHLAKRGTPTMGGLMIMSGLFAAVLLWGNLRNPYVWIVLGVTAAYGAIGFYDDYLKVTKQSHKGFSGKSRLLLEALIAGAACAAISYFSPAPLQNQLAFPIFKDALLNLGWFYVLTATIAVVFVLSIAFSNAGNIRLGPDHSRPKFNTFSWASMLFAAGIGVDLMFFAVAEPVTMYMQPPVGDGETMEAAKEAVVYAMFHYGLTGWALYALMGMAFGYFAYRLNMPLAIRSALYPLIGKRVHGPIGSAVDIAAMLGTVFGVTASLGIGVVQLSYGFHLIFGIEQGLGLQSALIIIAVAIATLSAVSGVDKGIRFLSELNVYLAIALMVYVVVFGKTAYLFDAIVTNIGDYVAKFPSWTMETFAFAEDQANVDTWMQSWTLFFWAWWIAWATFVGLFLARISRGRTLRQFIFGTLTFPFLFILMWMSFFGNTALDMVRSGDYPEFAENAINVPEQGFYDMLHEFPGSSIVIFLTTFIGLLLYITSADSGALVMGHYGETDKHLGLWQIAREFAPYVGVVWERAYGGTADQRRAQSGDVDDTRIVAGVRIWF